MNTIGLLQFANVNFVFEHTKVLFFLLLITQGQNEWSVFVHQKYNDTSYIRSKNGLAVVAMSLTTKRSWLRLIMLRDYLLFTIWFGILYNNNFVFNHGYLYNNNFDIANTIIYYVIVIHL